MSADVKASRQHDQAGRPYRSFGGLLAQLGTLTRNQVLFAGAPAAIPVLTEPASEQRQAFDLIGAPIRSPSGSSQDSNGQKRRNRRPAPNSAAKPPITSV